MKNPPNADIQKLAKRLRLDSLLIQTCLDASVIEIHQADNRIDLGNASVFRLRRIERLCHTFEVDPSIALLLYELAERVAALEKQLARESRS